MTTPTDRGHRPRRTPTPTTSAGTVPAGPTLGPDRSAACAAEAALLGAALNNPRRARQVLGDLAPGDLADPGHAAVLAAIRAVLADGTVPDPALVLAAYNRGEYCGLPGNEFACLLADCLHHAGTPGTEGHYRRAVLEARWRRDAITAAHRIHQAATTAPLADLHAVLAEALTGLGATLARLTPTPAARPAASTGTRRPGPGTTGARTREAA